MSAGGAPDRVSAGGPDDSVDADGTIRVRHIPSGHVYVAHLAPVEESSVPAAATFLPDPQMPGAPSGQWWPHPALDPDWISDHADAQDVVHLHFGFESRTPEQLAAWIGRLRSHRIPLVYTVHDLDHPHLRDQSRHHAHLGLLAEHADALLTLTEGAADEVERRYGRRPVVVPHPHVVPLERMRQAESSRVPGGSAGAAGPSSRSSQGASASPDPLRIGVHLKSLRTNSAPLLILPPLIDAVGQLREHDLPTTLEIRAHPEVLDPEAHRYDRTLAVQLRTWRDDPPDGVEVVLAPRLDDDELWDYLAGLDVSVLPYAWATHSGWAEACRDLGTHVLAPDVGFLAEQVGVLTWGTADQPPSTARLVELLTWAAEHPALPTPVEDRVSQRNQVAQRHTEVYSTVLQHDQFGGEDA